MRDQRGFSLIEALVAILTGVVVTGALFAILEVSLRQTARLTDVVQANQLGRGTMTKIVDELRSSCLSAGFAPIQEKSTEKTLWFVTAVSEHSVISKTEAFEHEIVFNEAERDADRHRVSRDRRGIPQIRILAGKSLLGDGDRGKHHKGRIRGQSDPGLPLLQVRERRGQRLRKTRGHAEESPVEGATELKASANEIAAVNVTFKTAPATDKTVFQGHVPVEFSNQTTLAFSAPASESTVQDTPCH